MRLIADARFPERFCKGRHSKTRIMPRRTDAVPPRRRDDALLLLPLAVAAQHILSGRHPLDQLLASNRRDRIDRRVPL